MAVNLISVKCPDCGASLDIEEGRTQAFCTYCGAKVLLNNENEYIYRHIDEAGIKRAETDRIVKLKQMEMAEKKHANDEKAKSQKIIILLVLVAVSLIIMVSGVILGGSFMFLTSIGVILLLGTLFVFLNSKNKEKEEDDDFGDRIKVPLAISEYEKKNYTAVEAILKSAGFTNIQCIPLNDLTAGILKRPGMVESITINGQEIISGGKKFSPEAPVIISYHSLAKR